ncbi:MAG: hypothetical protein R3351_01935 [Nitrospirales bacterium]|nr:hypothetical protein [Nitrospirales bacterium]
MEPIDYLKESLVSYGKIILGTPNPPRMVVGMYPQAASRGGKDFKVLLFRKMNCREQ